MKPIITENNGFIEVVGHYADKVLCAKMTLLADLYAVEHREGYAKFPAEYKELINGLDASLEFAPSPGASIIIDGVTVGLSDGNWDGIVRYSADFSISDGRVYYQGRRLQYNGVDVTTADNVHTYDNYTTVQEPSNPGTWIINEQPNVKIIYYESYPAATAFSINFVSNGENYEYFCIQTSGPPEPGSFSPYFNGWDDQAYRTVTFETAPTGSLLTWLEANAVKQEPSDITLDLSTVGLPDGTHSIQLKLSDDGLTKADSDLSEAVEYTAGEPPAPSGFTVTIQGDSYMDEDYPDNCYYKANGTVSRTDYDGYVDSDGIIHGLLTLTDVDTISFLTDSQYGSYVDDKFVWGISHYSGSLSFVSQEGHVTTVKVSEDQTITVIGTYD